MQAAKALWVSAHSAFNILLDVA